jgi:hypothetical protein
MICTSGAWITFGIKKARQLDLIFTLFISGVVFRHNRKEKGDILFFQRISFFILVNLINLS